MSFSQLTRRRACVGVSIRPVWAASVALVFGLAGSGTLAGADGPALPAESPPPAASPPSPAKSSATLAEIETCASENLPSSGGVIGFSVDAVDRTGAITASRAELRWRKPEDQPTQILLVVSEPAKTAGTALLIIDRQQGKPEFFVRLPEMKKVKQVRSRRLRGPVLGTDFSYEDLKRLREPLDQTQLELIGTEEIEGRPTWILETIPGDDDRSEYSRVLTYVDHVSCLPIRIDLFEAGVDGADRLRKRLAAPAEEIRPVAGEGEGKPLLPHQFVMRDLRRETRTVVRIERFEVNSDLPAEQFTRAALQNSAPSPPAAPQPASSQSGSPHLAPSHLAPPHPPASRR
jgi:hypothetical protein